MKRIVYFAPYSIMGGGEISILLELKHLDKKEFTPLVICYEHCDFEKKAQQIGISVIIFKIRNSFSSTFDFIKMVTFLREGRFDFVHVNSLDVKAGIACFLAGVPCIGHLRVIFPFTWRDRFFVRLARKTIAVSSAVREHFCVKHERLKKKFVVIPNAIELPEVVSPTLLKEEFKLSLGSILIGSVGRIDPRKGLEFFVYAASLIKKEIPNAFFFVFGSPSSKSEKAYFAQLEKMVTDLGLEGSFFWGGFRENILSVIAALNVAVIPSAEVISSAGVQSEGFGRVAIEAMALGVPVIVSNVGGLKEIVQDKITGIIVPANDAHAIKKAVCSLYANPGLREAVIRNGKQRAAQYYTVEKYMSAVTELYDSL